MLSYIIRRVLVMIPTLIGITLLVFMIIALSPGGVGASLKFSGGQMEATSRALAEAALDDRYGLKDPVLVQYARWLGRVSPIKFGPRDQITPGGEWIRPPRPVKAPPMWSWFAAELPTTEREQFTFEAGTSEEDRAITYRRAASAYADKRAALVALGARLELELGLYVAETNQKEMVRAGKVRIDRLVKSQPVTSAASWARVKQVGDRSIAAYAEAIAARERLLAVFAAKPYREAGVPLIPGAASLSAPDLGMSFSRGRPTLDLIGRALPVTIMLNLIAFPIIYLIAVPSGMLAAVRQNSWIDVASGMVFVILWSVPSVWAGTLAVGYLANKQYADVPGMGWILGRFPAGDLHSTGSDAMRFLPSWASGSFEPGFLLDTLWHLCLPVLCLVYAGFAILAKQTRAAMLDNFNSDYVRTAKAKGVPGPSIVFRHVFRNSVLPLITMFVSIFPAMLAGSVVVERIFDIPGMGSLLLDAINLRDRELILANTLMVATLNLLALLLADILYAVADPRISYK